MSPVMRTMNDMIGEIEALRRKASPGKWRIISSHDAAVTVVCDETDRHVFETCSRENAELIVRVVNGLEKGLTALSGANKVRLDLQKLGYNKAYEAVNDLIKFKQGGII